MVISQLEHTMTAEEVHKFYSDHENETYFLQLVEYMTSGPTIALVLAKANPGLSVIGYLIFMKVNSNQNC